MKIKNLFTAILFAATLAVLFAGLVQANIPTAVGIFLATLFLTLMPTPRGVLRMALQVEIWEADVVGNLYKDNQFAQYAFNADMYVLMGKVVHIPVAGAPGQVKKNLATFPQTAVKRGDSDVTYAIDTFYLLPRHIEEIEKYELEYDKRQSVVGEDTNWLIQCAMDNLLYKWAPSAANCILTDGNPTTDVIDGAAGSRNAFTKEAFKEVFKRLNSRNIPKQGRVALLTSFHLSQFIESLSEGEKTNFGKVMDLEKGIVGMYMGITVMERSSVLRYRGTDAAMAPVDELDEAFAADADDRQASLFWQRDCVERAFGEVKMFDNAQRAEYFGDIFSMILRMGGRQRRTNGVIAVVDALVA